MLHFKVYFAHSGHLCENCIHAVRITHASGTRHFCRALFAADPVEIGQPVLACNKFHHACAPSLGDMQEIAWEIEAKDGKPVGFKPPDRNKKP